MPIPSLKYAVQCRAKAKSTGARCLNLAVRGWPVCRLHGYHKTILRGSEHPCYAHGEGTKEKRAAAKAEMKELKRLKAVLKKMNTPP
jgi:hypothetical protein